MSTATASPSSTAKPLKKWAILLAIIVAVVCLGSAATTRWWLPWLQKFAHTNKDTIDEIKKLFDLVAIPIGVLSAIFAFIAKLWKGKEEPPASATKNEQAGRDIIHAEGNVQTGGVSVDSQGSVTLEGDAVGRDKIQTKIEIHLPSPLPQPPSVELVSKPRVVDAALPNHVIKDVATELLVLIRLPDSPGLRGILQAEEDVEARPEDVRSRPFDVTFPLGRGGKLDPLKVAVKLTSPDFSPPEQVKNIFVPPEKDSDVVPFLLTPLHVGPLTVLVELLWEDALHGHRHLTTKCVAEATEITTQPEMNLVQMSVAVGVGSTNEQAPALKNLPAASIPIDLPGGPHGGSASEAPAAPVLPSPPEPRKGPRRPTHEVLYRVRPPRTHVEYDVTDSEPSHVDVNAQGPVSVGGDVVGHDKIEIHEAAPLVLRSLHQLPAPPPDFQGRTRELAELRATMTTEKSAIAAVQGQGGIGKTSLALKLAEELSPDYADAQIYLDLKGVSDNPVPASEALAHVIRSFHPDAKLPERQSELEALYRSVLHQKHALLLLDNARDATQVAPLLPPQGCALLVTSRQHFTLPGMSAKNAKNLTALPLPDAEALLLRIVPPMEDTHAKAICKLCGFLPQALRLAAGAITNRQNLSPADYVRRLADQKNRPRVLAEGNESVEASIRLSYSLLDTQTRERWTSLGVFPDTFDLPAAAAVWEIELSPAQDTLGVLLQYSMLEWNEASQRYRLHDLMRDFARARLDATETQEAGKAHASHYLTVLQNASALYRRGGGAILEALALFDLEWSNIQAGQAWAANHAATNIDRSAVALDDAAAQLCSGYPDWGTSLLGLRQHPRERIRWREAALSAARNLKDRPAEGRHLGNLGLAYSNLGEYRRAIEYHEQSLAIAHEIGDRGREGQALVNLGTAYYSLGEYRRAIEYYNQRLAIAREMGDRLGEGSALGGFGVAYSALGENRRVIEFHEQALTIDRDTGDRRGEANALGNLGNAYHRLGENRRAIEFHEQALTIDRDIGDRRGEGQDLGNLGNAYYSLGEYPRAIEFHEQDLAIARQIGDRLGEANALFNTSLALDKLGQRRKAIEHARAALQISEQIESPHVETVRKQLQEWQAPAADASP